MQGKPSLSVAGREATPKLHEAVMSFLLDRRIAGCTDATVASYRFQLNPLAQWCADRALDLDTLSEDEVRSFLAHRQRVSQATLATACVRLKTFFTWCEQQGIAEDLARRIRRVKVQEKVVPTLSGGQIRSLLALCPSKTFTGKRDAALIRLLVDAGLRVSEALDITLDRIDLEGGRLIVNGKGQKQRAAFFGPKTAKALYVYLNARETVRPGHATLFITRDGRPLNRRHAHKQLERLGTRAGIEGIRVSPHTFRHTFATAFLRRGGDALALQRLLGHTSLTMTNRYVNACDEDLEAAHRRSAPGDVV